MHTPPTIQRLIEAIAISERGVKRRTVLQWRRRGTVPHAERMPIRDAALRLGVMIESSHFDNLALLGPVNVSVETALFSFKAGIQRDGHNTAALSHGEAVPAIASS